MLLDGHDPQLVPAMSDYHWYALKVRARNESTVSTLLQRKNYETFLPTFVEKRKYSDRSKEVDTPLYPGYVFCRFNALHRLPVLTTPAVEYIVTTGKNLTPVEEHELAAVRQVVDSGLPAYPWPYLKAGQRVRIEEGSLTGVEGILIREKGAERLVICVELVQRSVAVELDRCTVRPIH